MWVFFEGGFLSIVEDTTTGQLLVRARARDDLLRFCELCGRTRPGIISTPRNDYRFRVRMSREQAVRGLTAIVKAIEYPNFKSRVAKTLGVERAHVFSDVWAAALPIDERYRASRVKPGSRDP